jgi:pilus assembly protein CpaE
MEIKNELLTSIVIAPQNDRTGALSAALTELGHIRVLRSYQLYPSVEELGRVLQTAGPAIVFLGTEDTRRALELATAVDHAGTGAQVVILSDGCDPQVLVESMQAGIREFLSLPLNPDRLNEAVCRIGVILERKPLTFSSTDAVFSFLPAKPGDGASTVAVNVSTAIARRSPGKTLLADFDLNTGMVSFLLKLSASHSVLDALPIASRLDDSLWESLILKRDGLDVLCSGRLDPRTEADFSPLEELLQFARRAYRTICLDLSGNMEPFSLELLAQSREIFLVCTSDIPSLHFARSKAQFLNDAGFGERASVLINRSETLSPFSSAELEKLLGLRIRFAFPNDPRCVGSAMHAGTAVNPKSALGRQYATFAESVCDAPAPEPASRATRKRRFIEHFAILPSLSQNSKEKR